MKTYSNCPVCEKTSFTDHIKCNDNTGSDESFQIVKCNNCGFTFTNPIPLESDIGKYYESDDYISHSNTNKGLVSFLYQKVRNYTLDKKVNLLKSQSDGINLLDIGSGTGEFLGRAKAAGFNVKGIEPSTTGREQALANFRITVNDESSLPTFKDNSFDFITMWHVLEHVYHLNERVIELKRLIKEDGTIFIAVPNLESHDAKKYKEHWAAYDVPRHLYHFSPKDMTSLMEKHGMKIVEILPMKFDSYYVSMLSEKYLNGKTSLVNSFINGFQSNMKGDPEKTYSSQIYMIKKAN